MHQLLTLLDELETKVPNYTIINTEVSAGSVGWHIQHTSLVLVRIIDALMKSDPAAYKWKFNWKRSYLYLLNKIPRGKIAAPKSVQPQLENDVPAMLAGIEKAKGRVVELSKLHPQQYFTHPFLGDLKVSDAKKFLELHTKHHLKIINDILSA